MLDRVDTRCTCPIQALRPSDFTAHPLLLVLRCKLRIDSVPIRCHIVLSLSLSFFLSFSLSSPRYPLTTTRPFRRTYVVGVLVVQRARLSFPPCPPVDSLVCDTPRRSPQQQVPLFLHERAAANPKRARVSRRRARVCVQRGR